MKRKFLPLLLIAISSTQIVKAQIAKGTVFLGGQIGFSTGKTEYNDLNSDNRQYSYSFSSAIGVFTKNNLVWGGDISVIGSRSKFETLDPQRQLNLGGGVFVRQYFPLANRFYLFGQGRLGGYYTTENSYNGTSTYKGRGYSVGISIFPGISYALKKNIYLETGFNNLASINYTHLKRTSEVLPNSGSKSSSFGFGGSLGSAIELSIGIRFLLEKSAG